MAAMARGGERVGALHELRGHLHTIRLSAQLLDLETDLTEPAHMALKRIQHAISHAERELQRIEQASSERSAAMPLFEAT